MDPAIEMIKELVEEASRLVAFTGAGMSAESGIPTYRGAGGLWSKYDPSKYADIRFFLKDPTYYWSFFRDERYPMLSKARPNAAHIALSKLEQRNKLEVTITQNIDGLHQEAGQRNVIELHGNTRTISCMTCGKRTSWDEIFHSLEERFPPVCSCGGALRPDTVMFGESLPFQAIEHAIRASQECDAFLVLGSSLVVYPAADLPRQAKRNHAKLIIVNMDPTPLDSIADVVYHGKTSDALDWV